MSSVCLFMKLFWLSWEIATMTKLTQYWVEEDMKHEL